MMLRVDTPQNINTFARWNRALILHLVNRGSGEDDDAAIYYSIETARKHLESTEVSKVGRSDNKTHCDELMTSTIPLMSSGGYGAPATTRLLNSESMASANQSLTFSLGDLEAAHAFCELGMSLSRWCPNLGAGWQKSMQRLYQ